MIETLSIEVNDNGRVFDLATAAGIMLDIGCGLNKQPGFAGMDIRPLPGVDIVHDFESIPWPLPDECVLKAIASHVVEHINPHKFGFVNWMNELWRVMRPDGQIVIVTPYATSPGFYQDPTHCNPCNEATWAYFDPEHPSGLYQIYKPKPWRLEYIAWDPVVNMEIIMRKRDG